MSTNMNFSSEWMRGGFSKNVNNTFSDSPFEESNLSALKYSKEYMLSLYKPSRLPSDFKHHEYVTVEDSLTPLAFDELTELEKKLLSGPVHVEGSRRLIDKRNRMGHDNNPLVENGANRFSGRKGRDYFSKDSTFRRPNDNADIVKKRELVEDLTSPFGKPEDEVPWSKNGLFKDESPFKSEFAGDLGAPAPKNSEEVKWFYRDPSGQVQGPFEAREMQEWYKAGFFSPTLMLRREDESVFEPLMVIIQKVGNDDEPFLASRPPGPDLFASSEGLFGRNDKYMPFGTPTTPGGSIVDNFLGGSSNTPLYQSPYGGFGGANTGNSLLRDNLWNNGNQSLGSPSWMNHSAGGDLFGNPTSNAIGSASNSLGLSPFIGQQQQQQPNLNPMFGSNSSNGLFDYHRTVNDQQQYYQMLKQQQQKQQEHHQQQQQQLQQLQQQQLQQQQQQFQHMSLSEQHQAPQQLESERLQTEKIEKPHTNTIGQNTLKSLTLEHINSNHASPVLRANNILSVGSGWGSAPGTPLATDTPSSPWRTIGASVLPSKITDELQPKAPGAQSPRVPSSPKKTAAVVEKPKVKSVIESFADIQLEEMERKKEEVSTKEAIFKSDFPQTETFKETVKEPVAKLKVVTKELAPVPKPAIVSLREIQEEELRIAKEKKAKQTKAAPATSTWVSSPPAVVVPASSTWSQPVIEKPLSLREIQEMEAKNAELNKIEEVVQHVAPPTSWITSPVTRISIVTPTSSTSAVWTSTNSTPKKTLREIQQEEELVMKKKNAKNAAKATELMSAAVATNVQTKSSAVAPPVVPVEGWTTVSHVRAPKPAPVPTPAPVAPVLKEPTKWEPVKPAVIARVPAARGPSEDFRRWCRKALRGLNSGVNEDEILDMLLMFPVDSSTAEIIEDVIYANSLRIDGKRFAQEFMRRRKADSAGRLDIVTAGLEDDDDDDFKVVTKKNKKKISA